MNGGIEELLGGFGIEVFDEFGGVFEVGKQHRHLLAFAFQGRARHENLLGHVLGRVCLQPGKAWHRHCRHWRREILAAGITEAAAWWLYLAAASTHCFQPGAAGITKPGAGRILLLTPGT